jgi:hypothetical protein
MSRKRIYKENNPPDDNMLNEIIEQSQEDMANMPHLVHLFSTIEHLYLEEKVDLLAISELVKKHISYAKLVEWKESQKWDEKIDKIDNVKTTLYNNARQLVKMTLAIAKIDPSPNNISAYKRALESLVVLKRCLPAKKPIPKDNFGITQEHIAQFADAAGLDYKNPQVNMPENFKTPAKGGDNDAEISEQPAIKAENNNVDSKPE